MALDYTPIAIDSKLIADSILDRCPYCGWYGDVVFTRKKKKTREYECHHCYKTFVTVPSFDYIPDFQYPVFNSTGDKIEKFETPVYTIVEQL